MRRHGLAVVAVVVWSVSRGINALPAAHGSATPEFPAGLQVVLGGTGEVGLRVYALLWFVVAALALGALVRRVFAAKWLLPAAALTFGSALLFAASYAISYLEHEPNAAWGTAMGALAFSFVTYAYVFPTVRVGKRVSE